MSTAALVTALWLVTAPSAVHKPVYTPEVLARMATEPGDVETLESTESDPVGVAGLWGMVGHFIIAHGCEVVFAALSDIEKYPERMEKVKVVEVIERKPDALLVTYTEGGMGVEVTSTVLWSFDRVRRVITSKNVGPEDSLAWSEQRLRDVGHAGYCGVMFSAFVDVSWVPNFVLDFAASSAQSETAKSFRSIVEEAILDDARARGKATP